ncbi:MAG TPA: DUF3060 domain-containing protein [Kofleriaceae bacterium]|nr:DUF3060 domain-containing protein [Kofleriaceae bacterium]
MRSVAVAVALALVLAALAPGAARAEKIYTDKAATHDCAKEPEVTINAGGGTYTLTGPCTKVVVNGGDNKIKAESALKLSVNGSKNSVEIDAVDRLAVNGSDNTVTYKRGVTGKPKAAAIGGRNNLNQVK